MDTSLSRVGFSDRAYSGIPIRLHFMANVARIVLRTSVGDDSSDILAHSPVAIPI